MTATIQEQRLAQRFTLWDSDGNGRIERADYEAEATGVIRAFGESESSPKGRAVIDAYLGMWDFLAGQAGVGTDGSLSMDDFKQVATREILQKGDSGFSRVLRPTIAAIAALCDTDGDGQVSPAEFRRWLEVIGVPESKHDEAFRRIDTDRDGELSVDELVEAVRDYHEGTSEVPLLG